MRVFKGGFLFASLFVSFLGAVAQECDLYTDADAYVYKELYSDSEGFEFIKNSDLHHVGVFWFYFWWFKICRVERSYLHFPVDQLPPCVTGAFLRLNFSVPRPPGVLVEVGAVEWDGVSAFGWDEQPVPYWSTVFSVSSAGPYEVDVTEPVRAVIEGDRKDLAFVVRLVDESCPSRGNGWRRAFFDTPCLRFDPCEIEVKVEGLEDFTLTQAFLAGNRYAPLGDLTVTIDAELPYEARVCYEVEPEPSPPFPVDPVELAYTWVWITVPRCPSYISLPGFSGTPGTESRSYRVRVDLADLGDRAAEEAFTFVLRVWAVPE